MKRFKSRSKGTPEPRAVPHARSYQTTRVANLRDGYFGRSPYILQRFKRAVRLAAAEDRGVVRPEPEQVLVSVVALDQNTLHLSLPIHRSPLICEPFIFERVNSGEPSPSAVVAALSG
jgi:hypothetical protein